MLLNLTELSLEFQTGPVLDRISGMVQEHDHIALIGQNGVGKTTLLRLLNRELEPSSGILSFNKGLKIGYLPQNPSYSSSLSIEDELRSVFSDMDKLDMEIHKMEELISSDPSEKNLNRYAQLRQRFEDENGYSIPSRIQGVLKGLGFREQEYSLPMSDLSGGQINRVMLAKLLLMDPDLLLLDEPTNHLDMEAIKWLETFLTSYNKAYILISHDRWFLNTLCTKTWELENHHLNVYPGNYEFYSKEKKKRQLEQEKAYLLQQDEIKRQEEIAARFRSFGTEMFIKKAKTREKILEKMDRLEKPVSYDEKMRLSLNPHIRSGEMVIETNNLSKSFGSVHLFKNVNMEIHRGERVALIGPNGIGKTTLLKILLSEEAPSEGSFRFGVKVFPGYYAQTQENLNYSNTVLEEIYDTYPAFDLTEIRTILASFLFKGENVFKPISVLSGGEKARVELCKIMMGESNFLLLDEPTNHLDIQSREVLEDAISSYTGTVLFVSHDRYFINRIATRILELNKEGISSFPGNFDEYLAKKSDSEITNNNPEIEKDKSKNTKDIRAKSNIKPLSPNEIRRKNARIRELESLMDTYASEQEDINQKMQLEEFYSDIGKFNGLSERFNEINALNEAASAEWLALNEELGL